MITTIAMDERDMESMLEVMALLKRIDPRGKQPLQETTTGKLPFFKFREWAGRLLTGLPMKTNPWTGSVSNQERLTTDGTAQRFSISENISDRHADIKVAKGIAALLLFILISGNSIAQLAADKKDVQVWAVPGKQKVRPNDRVETKTLYGQGKKTDQSGRRRERTCSFSGSYYHTCTPGMEAKSPGWFVRASDLKSEKGNVISRDQVNLFLEHYIQIYAISSPVGATGLWPDALAT